MTDLREAIAALFKRHHRDTCYPDASDGEAMIFADAVLAILPDVEALTVALERRDAKVSECPIDRPRQRKHAPLSRERKDEPIILDL